MPVVYCQVVPAVYCQVMPVVYRQVMSVVYCQVVPLVYCQVRLVSMLRKLCMWMLLYALRGIAKQLPPSPMLSSRCAEEPVVRLLCICLGNIHRETA